MLDFTIQTLAAGLLFYGLWSMGNKRLRGPLVTAIAEVFTLLVGIAHNTWSIVVIGGVLAIVQYRNFLKWRAEGTAW